jgi:hypothetical protein
MSDPLIQDQEDIAGRIEGDKHPGFVRGERIMFLDDQGRIVLNGTAAVVTIHPMGDAVEWVVEVDHDYALPRA